MRFKIDKRVGIIAVVDTEHPDYIIKTKGLDGRENYVLAHWNGHFNKEEDGWFMLPHCIEKADKLMNLLNFKESLIY